MSTPAPDGFSRPSARPSRLEQIMTVPRVFSLFGALIAILIATVTLTASGSLALRVLCLWISVAMVLLNVRILQSSSARSFAFSVLWTALAVAFVLFSGLLQVPSAAGRMLVFAIQVFTIGGAIGMSLSLIRLLRPMKAGLLAFSVSAALALAAIPFEMRNQSDTPRQQIKFAATVDWSQAIPDELLWAGPKGKWLPEIEWVHVPHAYMKNYFPDNPRGYFDEEELYGAIDMRLGGCRPPNESKGLVKRPEAPDGIARIEPLYSEGQPADALCLDYNEIPFLKDQRYRISFVARSESPCQISVKVLKSYDERSPIGPDHSVELGSSWSEHSLELVPTDTARDGDLSFELGKAKSPVEIQRLVVLPLTHQVAMSADAWQQGNPQTAIRMMPSSTSILRAEPSSAAAARITQKVFPSREGVPCEILFRARADRAGKLDFGLMRPAAPLENATPNAGPESTAEVLGTVQVAEVGPEWKVFGVELSNLASEEAPLLFFEGVKDLAFELADIQLWPRDGFINADFPKRYSISYKFNADGYRDRDRPIEAPANTFRIACLGDSYTFGQGVREEETFVRLLEVALQQDAGARHYDVMNFGVCGHTTKQERLSYELFAKKYHPQLVLVTMVFNDNLSYAEEKALGMHDPPPTDVALLNEFRAKVANSYNDYGYDVCVRELKTLRERCRENGARLAVVIFTRAIESQHWEQMEKTITDGLRDTDIPILNLREALPDLSWGAQVVHRTDGHPNEVMHGIAAKAIANFLTKEKLLQPASDSASQAAK